MIRGWNFKDNIIKFLPLLLLYLILVILFSADTFQGDEGAYIRIATRLAGLGSPTDPVYIWFGPGYPIILIPFISFKLPWLAATLLNAFFLFGAVVYFYNTLDLWLPKTHATTIAYIFGLYPPLMRKIHMTHSENLVFFLICGFMFYFCMVFRGSKRTRIHLLLASLFLGYLALTKVIFGYVIIIGLLFFWGLYLWKRRGKFKQTALIILFAFVLCIPYLFYTYSVTGKTFYWGTSGGDLLYWMSSPYEGELGSWYSSSSVKELPYLEQHREFYESISNLSDVERDSEFKKQAIFNITQHPMKFFINWAANIGRLLFSYPFSFTQQKLTTYFYLIPNMFIVVLFIIGIIPVVLRWQLIPFEIYALLFFDLVAFGGISLLSAVNRFFVPLVPILFLWLSYIYIRLLKIKLQPKSAITSA